MQIRGQHVLLEQESVCRQGLPVGVVEQLEPLADLASQAQVEAGPSVREGDVLDRIEPIAASRRVAEIAVVFIVADNVVRRRARRLGPHAAGRRHETKGRAEPPHNAKQPQPNRPKACPSKERPPARVPPPATLFSRDPTGAGVHVGLAGGGGAMGANRPDPWTTSPPTIVSTDSRSLISSSGTEK